MRSDPHEYWGRLPVALVLALSLLFPLDARLAERTAAQEAQPAGTWLRSRRPTPQPAFSAHGGLDKGRGMRRLLAGLGIVVALLVGTVSLVAAQEEPQQAPHCPPGVDPQYVHGFKALHDNLGLFMGDPLTCEFADPNGTGDVHQVITEGLAFWRKSTNTPTFTNGWEHWAITEAGLVYWLGESIDPIPEAVPVDPPAEPAGPAALEDIQLALEPVADGFRQPVHVVAPPDGSDRLFVVERAGRIRIVEDGAALPTPFLDVTPVVGSGSTEQGLLGLAFHPEYASNGRFFINYTDRAGDTVVAQYTVSPDPNVADPTTGSAVLTLDQPAANHNGGNLVFGPDGYLWIGTGDGGGAGDRFGNAQDLQALLGKMLRIDVDGGEPYGIPPDNPFVDRADARPEIWAYGLRNPWRYSFDRQTGDLFIGDVGQNAWEEVDHQPAGSSGGQNYGWPMMEAAHCYPSGSTCDPAGLVPPIAEYRTGVEGCAVTGGYMYRGEDFPQLAGTYLFGDACSGRMWGLQQDAQGGWTMAELRDTGVQISSFGQDEVGELYVTGLSDGVVYRLNAL